MGIVSPIFRLGLAYHHMIEEVVHDEACYFLQLFSNLRVILGIEKEPVTGETP